MSQPFLYSLIDKADYDYHMINDGDKILIGASGGKDSTALIEYFTNRQKRKTSNFTFTALNIKSDFASAIPQQIVELFDRWGCDYKSIDVDILKRVKPGFKMSCYWCSTQRRTELLRYALANGYNKIALGHHKDDILETVIMNALNQGVLRAMPPVIQYEKYPLHVIRPLCYATEDIIIDHAKEGGYLGFTCTCNYQQNSDRKIAKQKLAMLCEGVPKGRDHLFSALKNIEKDYLV